METLIKKFLDGEISRRVFLKGLAAFGTSLSLPTPLVRGASSDKTCGWTNALLRVDLSSGELLRAKTLDYAEDFAGGRALAARIYYDDVSPSISALDPDNEIIVTSGPLGGTGAYACSRWVITAKSPLVYPDQHGFGNGGGYLGATLKQAGYDGITIRGKAKSPSYLLIENEKAEIKDAKGLWGLTSDETMKKLRSAHGDDARIVCIGPAGENLVRIAVACTDIGGALSGGLGAVMGSKNIKAIVVKGNKQVPVAYPEKVMELGSSGFVVQEISHLSYLQ